MPLSRKHFVEFADFMVNLWSGKAVLQIKIENAINKKLENFLLVYYKNKNICILTKLNMRYYFWNI